MPDQERTPLVCSNCGSPKVVSVDESGAPLCAVHAALELGGRDGQQSAVLELLEMLGGFVAESGLCHPSDAVRAFCEAIGKGEARRDKLNLRPVPTFEHNLAQLTALGARHRPDDTIPEES